MSHHMAPQHHFKVYKTFFMFTCACVCVLIHICLQRPKEAQRLGPGVPVNYDPLDVGIELQSFGRATSTPNC